MIDLFNKKLVRKLKKENAEYISALLLIDSINNKLIPYLDKAHVSNKSKNMCKSIRKIIADIIRGKCNG